MTQNYTKQTAKQRKLEKRSALNFVKKFLFGKTKKTRRKLEEQKRKESRSAKVKKRRYVDFKDTNREAKRQSVGSQIGRMRKKEKTRRRKRNKLMKRSRRVNRQRAA